MFGPGYLALQGFVWFHVYIISLIPSYFFTKFACFFFRIFRKDYADLKGYDEGTIEGGLEHRDSASWQKKSWIIGLHLKASDRAYDWNELVKEKMIQDSINDMPVLLTLASNGKSFYGFNRKLSFAIKVNYLR